MSDTEGFNNTAKTLNLESLKDALRLFEERMGSCALAANRFASVMLVPQTFKIPPVENQLHPGARLPDWGIPVIRTQYLPTVSLEPAMPTRTGRTRRGYKIAHKYALNERRRRSRFLGQFGYLIKAAVDQHTDAMFREMFTYTPPRTNLK